MATQADVNRASALWQMFYNAAVARAASHPHGPWNALLTQSHDWAGKAFLAALAEHWNDAYNYTVKAAELIKTASADMDKYDATPPTDDGPPPPNAPVYGPVAYPASGWALQWILGDAGRFGSVLSDADAAPNLSENWRRFAQIASRTHNDNAAFRSQVTKIGNVFEAIS